MFSLYVHFVNDNTSKLSVSLHVICCPVRVELFDRPVTKVVKVQRKEGKNILKNVNDNAARLGMTTVLFALPGGREQQSSERISRETV